MRKYINEWNLFIIIIQCYTRGKWQRFHHLDQGNYFHRVQLLHYHGPIVTIQLITLKGDIIYKASRKIF